MKREEPQLPLFLVHGVLFVFDKNEPVVGSTWTREHAAQGFVRRPSTMNVSLLEPEDVRIVEIVNGAERVDACADEIAFSLHARSGEIQLGTEDPGGIVVWRGRPGWVRIALQMTECAGDAPTYLKRGGQVVSAKLVETA